MRRARLLDRIAYALSGVRTGSRTMAGIHHHSKPATLPDTRIGGRCRLAQLIVRNVAFMLILLKTRNTTNAFVRCNVGNYYSRPCTGSLLAATCAQCIAWYICNVLHDIYLWHSRTKRIIFAFVFGPKFLEQRRWSRCPSFRK